MDNWIPLYAACIGGLLATIPLLLGLIVQVGLHISENRQKKKDAKTQLELELVRKDVDIVEKNINDGLFSMQFINDLIVRRIKENLSGEEIREQIRISLSNRDGELYKLSEFDTISDSIAYSFGDEFNIEYGRFHAKCLEHWEMVIEFPSDWKKQGDDINKEAIRSASKLHVMLQEKLLSVRR